ncbi:MAG: type IV pilus twitching motility protein PilT [Patescibacteria group bacterium]
METTQNITLKRLLALSAERSASDLHIVVGNKPTIRIDGQLVVLEEEEVITQDFVATVIEAIATEEQRERLEKEKELIFLYDFVDQNRFRVDITKQRGMYSLEFHYVPSIVKKLTDLGFPKEIDELTMKSQGLVVISGRQGSGVTTTLAGFAETINQREAKTILILSDPVEYSMVSHKSIIQQQEIGTDTNSWMTGLDIGEQDVDVVIASDVPNGEVLKRLINLSQNGVLVCVGYQASSVDQVVKSLMLLLDQGELQHYADLFSRVFVGAVVQALVPKIGGGKVLSLEVALGTASMQRTVAEMKFDQIHNLIQTSRSDGMITMDRYLQELYRSGQVDKENALAFARSVDSFNAL